MFGREAMKIGCIRKLAILNYVLRGFISGSNFFTSWVAIHLKKTRKKILKNLQQQSSQFPGKSPPGHSPAGIPEYNHYVRKTLWRPKKKNEGYSYWIRFVSMRIHNLFKMQRFSRCPYFWAWKLKNSECTGYRGRGIALPLTGTFEIWFSDSWFLS